jgi:NADPH:quinone reductase-like Zn-dependent oxidoreductase
LKAIVITQYGPPEVLQLREIATPTPAVDQVLIKLYAASVNPLDSFMMRGPLFFLPSVGKLLKPKHQVIGADIAGRVESVGKDIKKFRTGDEVFGASFQGKGLGGFAEYVCSTEDRLALKPVNLSFEQAAAVPVAAITALQGLRDHGQIERGQTVLIDGASGGVGTFAVQIAKSFGAEVTAVCGPGNVDQARLIGADHVIDYTQEDFTRSGQRYDLILGVNAHHSIFAYRRALAQTGFL